MGVPRKRTATRNANSKAKIDMEQQNEAVNGTPTIDYDAMDGGVLLCADEDTPEVVEAPRPKQAYDDATIMAIEKTAVKQLQKQNKLRIIINSGTDAHENAPVRVGVNGREYIIKRDVEVDVPKAVVNVLKRAKEKVGVMVDNPQTGRRHVDFHEKNRFSYQVLGPVDKDGNLSSGW